MSGLTAMICIGFNSCRSISEDLTNLEELKCEWDFNNIVNYHDELTTNIESLLEASVVINKHNPLTEQTTTRAVTESANNANVTPVIVDMEFVERPQDINISSIQS